MATNLKSAAITSLDATPVGFVMAGAGVGGMLRSVEGSVAALTGDVVGSTYKLVRLPINAMVKKVELYAACATAGAADFNAVFSDSTQDGTDAANQGTIPQIGGINNKLFGAAQSLIGGLAAPVELTYANAANFPVGSEQKPLWAILGFSGDPGGFFDIQATVTTAITTGGIVFVRVFFVV